MFQSYLQDIEKENNSSIYNAQAQQNSSTQQSIWDDYIDRQLEHLVVEYQFDFDKIAQRLAGVIGDKQQQKVNFDTCRQRWKQLHLRRYEDKDKDRLDRVSKSVMKMEDPNNALKVQELVEKLPKARQNKDFLKISDEEKLQAFYLNDKGEKIQPTTFNVLKDSVMGIKDKTERERVFKKQQEEFFKSLEKLAGEQDEDMFTKPLIFRAKFTEPTNFNFIVEREELTREQAQRIMSQKVQIKGAGLVPPEPEMGIKMDNYVSMFARPDEEEEELKKKDQEKEVQVNQQIMQDQQETKEEQERDQEELKKQMELTEEEKKKQQEQEEEKKKINVDLYLAERGLKSIDEALNSLEKMRSKVKVNNYFEEAQTEDKKLKEQKEKNQQKVDNEDQIRQEIIKQGLEQLKQKEQGDQLVQFHENQIKKDIKELNEIIGDNKSKNVKNQTQQPNKAVEEEEEIILEKKNDQSKKVPTKKGIFSQFAEEEDSGSEDEVGNDEEELDDELYLQAQRIGLKSDAEIDLFITKKKEERKANMLNKKKVQFSEFSEQKQISEDTDELLAKQEKQIKQKQQFLEKLKKKSENEAGENDESNQEGSQNWRDLEFSAGMAFKRQLEEEKMQRMIKEQFEEEQRRKADQERIRQIQEEYHLKKLDIETKIKLREPLNLEKVNQEKWKEYIEAQQKRREEIEKEFEEKQRIQTEQEEKEQKENLIKEKIHFFEQKIKNFPSNDPFKCFFDDQVSYLSQISSLPSKITTKIADLKKYDISRDGITSRYQILIFPYLDKCQEFVFQFLSFFLRNSFFRQPPSEKELGEIVSENPLDEIPCQRLSSKGFPFCLVSFYIGSHTSEINDEQDEQYLSNYLNDAIKFDKLINDDKLQKSIYLFFDTYIGRGQDTLSKQLDLALTEFLSDGCLDQAIRKYGEKVINRDMKLSDFKTAYYKNMEIAKKLFNESNTFHSICPTKTSYHQTNQLAIHQNKKKQLLPTSPSNSPSIISHSHGNKWETSVIIIRNYSEIQNPSALRQQQNRGVDFSNASDLMQQDVTTEQYSNLSESLSNLVPSHTEISQRQKQQMTDVIHYTLNKLQEKGIQILGMKSFFFDQKTVQEFKSYVENINFNTNTNQPIVVISVAGFDLHSKLKKMVGSEDAQLAKRVEPNSLNALFSTGRDDSIIIPYNKALSRRLISYFFCGRLEKIQTVQDIQVIEGLTNKKQLYLTKPKPFNPVFLLNSQPIREHICLLSSKFLPQQFCEVIRKIQARGFELLNIRVIDSSNLSAILKKDEDFSAFIENENLQELNSGENDYERINLVLHIQGANISSLRNTLLNKIIDYNPFLHPSKREIFYYTKDDLSLTLLKDIFFNRHIKSNFTPSERFPLFIALWPFLNDYEEKEGLTASQAVPLGNDLKIMSSYGLELLSVSKIFKSQIQQKLNTSIEEETEHVDLKSILHQLIQNNIQINSITKKKPEFSTFCSRLGEEILSQDFYLAVFRYQGDRQSKHLDKLFTEVPFVHSNKTINESTVVTHGAKQTPHTQAKPLPTEFLTLFFLDSSAQQVSNFTKLLGIGAFDDWSFKGSFIFDLPSSGYTGEIETLIILSEDVVKTLLLVGLVKIIENNQFKIKSFFKHRCSREFSEVIQENLLQAFSGYESQMHDQGTKLQKIKASLDNLMTRLQGESMYFLVLSKENGIFNGKKILFELAEKYSVFKKETINVESSTEYMLDKGMYCSLNYKCQQREFKELQFMSQQILSMAHENNQEQQDVDKMYDNQLVMVIRIDQQIQLYEVFRKLQSDLKFKIIHFLVMRQFEWTDIQYISSHFTPKFEAQHIQKYFEINNDGIYCIVHLDSKNSVSLSDAFGTLRLNEKGEFKQVIRSSLFGKQEVFFIYTNNPQHVKKLSAYAFKSSE
ncbi:hypothetical protein TTHERM_00030520 (macronuclear) [Tetrahymena thermophila SB210]|uniref:Nucleoside diphosphate kinase domain-containing protein n=1 Tax=Tetrahymena thermophila (strain SB210) TaxID=312017 RepID=NDK_TETTS|nr:hypothetical protein TTHERM_00030520 [Tetrahymena thermophila SB210]EAR86471.2 hypothetical protein TTHERM_00030520 [Tetrahymena thermophila SB210]|eukprot:XP_976949.2 hypothetical protein TTHERM_00030520 [Tetrahymena thermophila SB210]